MINLMPYDMKKQTKAARMNVVLVRYIFILGIAIGFVAIACGAAYLFLSIAKNNNNQQIERRRNTPVSAASAVGQADTLRTDLSTAKGILDEQVSYSNVVLALGALLPKGTILDSLTLNDSSFGSAINLKIRAVTASLEGKVKEGFEDSSQFSGYKLISSKTEAGNPNYPTAFNISVTVRKGVVQ